jgi:hypothetical protein
MNAFIAHPRIVRKCTSDPSGCKLRFVRRGLSALGSVNPRNSTGSAGEHIDENQLRARQSGSIIELNNGGCLMGAVRLVRGKMRCDFDGDQ